jgi:hypothetical protein
MGKGINAKEGSAARAPGDFYPTPLDFIRGAIDRMINDTHIQQENMTILDPGCGEGAWGVVLREFFPAIEGNWLGGVEKEISRCAIARKSGAYDEVVPGDYEQINLYGHEIDLIVGNPPYRKLAESFARKSLEIVRPGGYVFMLFKASFWMDGLARAGAGGLFTQYPPMIVYKVFPRPFKRHAEPYCLILWRKGYEGETKTEMLKWK